MTSHLLDIQDIECRYGSKTVVEGFGFSLQSGQIACLLGASGCGKTTVLRAIAGFEKVHNGSISLENQLLSSPQTQLPPESRQVGMVFQDYALFPHMNIADNIGFGLHKLDASARTVRVGELLALVQLGDYAEVYPHQLSGGQQQRVALARALAPKPRLLLLDEPFSNLDTELRRSLSLEVRRILKQQGTTAILVTHDRSEAFNVADEIGVMAAGKLQQWGEPQALYRQPANPAVARFICDGKFIPGTVTTAGTAESQFGELIFTGHENFAAGTDIQLLIRPWEVVPAANLEDTFSQRATVRQQQFHGALSVTTLELPDGSLLESSDAAFAGHHVDDELIIRLESPSLLAFARESAA